MQRTVISLAALLVLAVVSVGVVLMPAAMTEPFRFHTPELIEWLYAVRSWGTTIAVGMLLAGALIAYRLWKDRTSMWAPLLGAIPLAVLVVSVLFSRQQLIEWIMFAPPETVAYEAAAGATHVAESDYVMGVTVGAEARAYPILMVAYYHIVNEEIDGEPYVVTY